MEGGGGGDINTVYTPISGVSRFPVSRPANSDILLKRHDLYRKQQLRRQFHAPLNGDSLLNGTPLKGVYIVPEGFKGRIEGAIGPVVGS